jgi:2,4-dichlorophenol 6-monooxygenase
MKTIKTDVLVVGAGPSGLTATALLARAGIDAITITKYPGTADSPRAHITNQRTVEVLRDVGVETDLMAEAMPQDLMGAQIFATSFVGLELGRMMAWGAGLDRRSDYLTASPSSMCNIPQHKLEPIILKAAVRHRAAVRFNSELVRISQDRDLVHAIVLDREHRTEYEIQARYVIAADGARSKVAEEIGFAFEGVAAVGEAISVWLNVDLTRFTKHRSGAVAFIAHQASDIWMSVWPCVTPWTEWNPFFFRHAWAPGPADHETLIGHIRDAIGDPSVDFHIKKITRWDVNHMVAQRYREGRVFLAGDAAHRHPPANGLGSNTSVQDAYNLCWKLILVLNGKADESLLDTYGAERKPVGRQVIDRAMRSVEDVLPWSDAMGLKPGMTAEEATANLEELYGDTERGAERRAAVLATLKAMDFQFNAHGVELGQRYHDGAVVSDGTPFPPYRLDPELYYQPTTHPGAHLPHVWLQHGHGRISTLDWAHYDRFTLITGIGGQAWIDAAAKVSRALNVDIAAFSVGLGQPYDDVLAEWTAIREVKDCGCVLVRPDRVVAWRSMDRVDDPVDALRNVLLRVLANGTTQARKKEESVA